MADQSAVQLLTRASAPASVSWRQRYRYRLIATDTLIVIAAGTSADLIWLGEPGLADAGWGAIRTFEYSLNSFLVIICWLVALAVSGSRSPRVIGYGITEYSRVISSAAVVVAGVAVASYLLDIPTSRGFLLIAFPTGLFLLLVGRRLWRVWLHRERATGRSLSSRVMVVGPPAELKRIVRDLRRNSAAGYVPVGVCTPAGVSAELDGLNLPRMGSYDDIYSAMLDTNADTVIVASDSGLSADRIRRLSWELLPGSQHLIVAPSLVDIASPRILTRAVAGVPLIHIATPRFDGTQRLVKRVTDIVGSGLLIVIMSPLLAGIAALVKLTSEGTVLYRQERIGTAGRPFEMLKFRSMRMDADSELTALLAAQGTDGTPLFKVTNDPRVTPIGAVLRKFSLDELPQLFNVFRGDMSLVGPRPQRAAEVALYDDAARRRLILKPGMSGLWQVSGRSELTWDESVRLDLYYVENWTFLGDVQILFRTFRAVFLPGGSAH